jgi:hypothetical protein
MNSAPAVRWALDSRWFPYVAYGGYRVGHFVARCIVYQCFIRPIARLRRRRRPHPTACVAGSKVGRTMPAFLYYCIDAVNSYCAL